MPDPATVTYNCGCSQCSCIATVVSAGALCGNCANGAHHESQVTW